MTKARVRGRRRQEIVDRAGSCCEYCRIPQDYGTQSFSVEHILPEAQGGSSDEDNLALSCQGCNAHKYTFTVGYDPVTKENVSLFHPRQEVWADHFAWSEDYLEILGMTATGRATVEKLQLNRANVQRLRRLLLLAGDHPPAQE